MSGGEYVPTTKERRRTLGDLVDKYIREAIPKKVTTRPAQSCDPAGMVEGNR